MAIKVTVQDAGTFDVERGGRSNADIQRQLAQALGAPWITQATVCELAGGNLELKRPAAAPKGR